MKEEIKQLACGCKTSKMIDLTSPNIWYSMSTKCTLHKELELKEQREQGENKLKQRMGHLEELECEICGKLLCMVYSYDLEGSHFYCKACVALYEEGQRWNKKLL